MGRCGSAARVEGGRVRALGSRLGSSELSSGEPLRVDREEGQLGIFVLFSTLLPFSSVFAFFCAAA